VKHIQHVCFHGPSALARGQKVLYVTERAVFELTSNGLRLLEVAPGFDVQRDVLDQMEFAPEMVGKVLFTALDPLTTLTAPLL
jgi:propionate CoA-transferase